MKKYLYLITLMLILSSSAKSQFTIDCDPIATLNKMDAIRVSSPDPAINNPEVFDRSSGFGFNSSNNNVGLGADTCFIVNDLSECGLAEDCRLLCCISSGIAKYTILCGGNGPSHMSQFINGGFNGISNSYAFFPSTNTIEFYDSHASTPGKSIVTTETVLCDPCIEQKISNYLEEIFGDNTYPNCDNYKCSVYIGSTNTAIFPPTVSLNVITTGCNGTEVPLGWTGESLPLGTSPKRNLGGGYSCPSDNLSFPPGSVLGAGGGGAVEYCFKAVCFYPYGIKCTTQCCLPVCMNVKGPLKSAASTSNPIGIEVYPNPVKDNLSLKINSNSDDVIQVNIVSFDRREVTNNLYRVSKGLNKYEIDVKRVSPGLYHINIQSRDFKETKSFLKE